MKPRLTRLLCFGALLASTPAWAYDFVFNVPVEIRNVHPDVHGIEFACETLSASRDVVGRGGARVNVDRKAGRVNEQMIQIRFNARPGKRAAEASRYRCFINYLQATGEPRSGEPGTAQADERFRAAPGSAFVREVQGSL